MGETFEKRQCDLGPKFKRIKTILPVVPTAVDKLEMSKSWLRLLISVVFHNHATLGQIGWATAIANCLFRSFAGLSTSASLLTSSEASFPAGNTSFVCWLDAADWLLTISGGAPWNKNMETHIIIGFKITPCYLRKDQFLLPALVKWMDLNGQKQDAQYNYQES